MKTNLLIDNPTYFVHEDDGIVVCVIHCYIKAIAGVPMLSAIESKKCPVSLDGFHFTVKAVAKCHNEDKFDITKGKRIAESRCKAKVFRKASLFYKHLLDFYSNNLHHVMNYCYNNSWLYKKELNHINELCK